MMTTRTIGVVLLLAACQSGERADMRVPDMRAPDMRVRDTRVPDIVVRTSHAPNMHAPDIGVRTSHAPDMRVPDTRVPDTRVPDIVVRTSHAPDMHTPDIVRTSHAQDMPDMHVPDMHVPDTRVRSATSSPNAASCKPEAPVAVEITRRLTGGAGGNFGGPGLADHDELEIIARATPSANVRLVELRLALPSHAIALGPTSARFGATRAGEERVLAARVRVDQRTSSIAAIARVPVDDVEMSRTATLDIGAPAPVPVTTTYALPDGELVREVRP